MGPAGLGADNLTTYLLLGAGFSRNWGGWLASETFEYLLGTAEVRANEVIRALLWKHQRQGGFEYALAELQVQASRSPHGPETKALNELQAAVLRMFSDMNRAYEKHDWNFTNDMSMQVGPFLGKFDAIFTLNQDILLELNYVPNIHAYGLPRFRSVTLPGMRRRVSVGDDPRKGQSWAWSRWVPEGDFAVLNGCQPIYKLHGSANWHVADGDSMLIIGGEKSGGIARNQVLSTYMREFERRVSTATAKLMVIGYGFRDDHINRILFAAANLGMKLFVIDPLGGNLADSLNLTRKANHVIAGTDTENLFERSLIGASRRGLADTFNHDYAEHDKLMRFFDERPAV